MDDLPEILPASFYKPFVCHFQSYLYLHNTGERGQDLFVKILDHIVCMGLNSAINTDQLRVT